MEQQKKDYLIKTAKELAFDVLVLIGQKLVTFGQAAKQDSITVRFTESDMKEFKEKSPTNL